MNATMRPRRDVPPGGTPLRELAHAIAQALTLPNEAVDQGDATAYLRISRDRARVVLFSLRRILADREIDDNGVMAVVADIRYQTGQLEDGDASPADPFREFVEAITETLGFSPAELPASEMPYLIAVRKRARHALMACRRATAGPVIEDADLAAAVELLGGPPEPAPAGAITGDAPELIP